MSTIYKRPDSDNYYYAARYNGKKIRKSTGFSMKKHAEIIKRKWDSLLANDDLSFLNKAYLPHANIDMFSKEYLKIRERISENTTNTSKSVLKHFFQYLKINKIDDIRDINVRSIDGYIDYLKLSPKTIKNHIIELRQMFNKAVNNGIIGTNPVIGTTLPKMINNNLHRRFELSELRIIFKEAGEYRLYYEFLYYTGLRAGDVSSLRYSDIDKKKSTIVHLISKAERTHEIPLVDYLISRLDTREDKTPIFPSLYASSRRKLNDKYAKPRKHLQSILKSHGLKHGTLHSFRTTFNNALRDMGLNIDDRAALLTHSSSETTKIYTQPNIEKALEYVNNLPIF